VSVLYVPDEIVRKIRQYTPISFSAPCVVDSYLFYFCLDDFQTSFSRFLVCVFLVIRVCIVLRVCL
jgi:hypothetical protein